MKNCICIGQNAGFDLQEEDGYIRIGDFSDGTLDDCYVLQDGKVVIKKSALTKEISTYLP